MPTSIELCYASVSREEAIHIQHAAYYAVLQQHDQAEFERKLGGYGGCNDNERRRPTP